MRMYLGEEGGRLLAARRGNDGRKLVGGYSRDDLGEAKRLVVDQVAEDLGRVLHDVLPFRVRDGRGFLEGVEVGELSVFAERRDE